VTAWWESLNLIERTFACVAIPATVILFLQTLLLLFASFGGDANDFNSDHNMDLGHDADHDVHIEHDHAHEHSHDDGLRIFTVRGFVTFFCIFGWAGLVMIRSGVPAAVSVVSAVILGFIFMVLVAYILVQFLKLQSNGAVDIQDAVGVNGSVYLTVPASRSGMGKVNAVVSGRYSEFNAVTDGNDAIPTKSAVTVVGVTGNNTLVVIKK